MTEINPDVLLAFLKLITTQSDWEQLQNIYELSKAADLPLNIDRTREEKRKEWNKFTETSPTSTHQIDNKPTQEEYILFKAGKIIRDTLVGVKFEILEIMSGNCQATKSIYSIIKESTLSIISTDIVDYPKILPPKILFDKLDSIDAVSKYGMCSNVLLIISPPPSELYGDYYACKDFIDKSLRKTEDCYIIILGELGASDGSPGMHKYITQNPHLTLIKMECYHTFKDILGGKVEKNIFICKIKNKKL